MTTVDFQSAVLLREAVILTAHPGRYCAVDVCIQRRTIKLQNMEPALAISFHGIKSAVQGAPPPTLRSRSVLKPRMPLEPIHTASGIVRLSAETASNAAVAGRNWAIGGGWSCACKMQRW